MTRTRKDWLKWTAMGFALVATFHAEYTLAVASGMHAWVALAVPGALDAYVVRTLVRSREVLTAVLAMVAVNVCSHLVTAGVLTVGWPIIAAVSAIAPLVLWRVHALGTPGEWRARTIWNVPKNTSTPEHAGTVSVPVEHETEHETAKREGWCPNCAHDWHGEHTDVHGGSCVVAPCSGSAWGEACPCANETRDMCGYCDTGEHDVNVGPVTSEWDKHLEDVPGLGDYVPAEWSTPDKPEHDPVPGWNGTVTVDKSVPARWPHGEPGSDTWLAHYSTPGVVPPLPEDYEHVARKAVESVTGDQARVLSLVPPLPEGYVLAELTPADMEHMDTARVLDKVSRTASGNAVPVRVLKTELNVGTPRAQRIRAALDAEHAKSTEGTLCSDCGHAFTPDTHTASGCIGNRNLCPCTRTPGGTP